MLQAAVEGEPCFQVDDRELRRSGASYTVDTLRELTAEYPADQLSLLVGADAAVELGDWRDAERIPALARVVLLTRAGVDTPRSTGVASVIEVPAVPISATEVRRRIAVGETIRELVPPAVADYIERYGLYSKRD
jgi:nicotinate-nucleotide adenylyltransferase